MTALEICTGGRPLDSLPLVVRWLATFQSSQTITLKMIVIGPLQNSVDHLNVKHTGLRKTATFWFVFSNTVQWYGYKLHDIASRCIFLDSRNEILILYFLFSFIGFMKFLKSLRDATSDSVLTPQTETDNSSNSLNGSITTMQQQEWHACKTTSTMWWLLRDDERGNRATSFSQPLTTCLSPWTQSV